MNNLLCYNNKNELIFKNDSTEWRIVKVINTVEYPENRVYIDNFSKNTHKIVYLTGNSISAGDYYEQLPTVILCPVPVTIESWGLSWNPISLDGSDYFIHATIMVLVKG